VGSAGGLYLTSRVMLSLWLLNSGAYMLWMLAMPVCLSARNSLSRPPHRKRSEWGRASGSEGVWRSNVADQARLFAVACIRLVVHQSLPALRTFPSALDTCIDNSLPNTIQTLFLSLASITCVIAGFFMPYRSFASSPTSSAHVA